MRPFGWLWLALDRLLGNEKIKYFLTLPYVLILPSLFQQYMKHKMLGFRVNLTENDHKCNEPQMMSLINYIFVRQPYFSIALS